MAQPWTPKTLDLLAASGQVEERSGLAHAGWCDKNEIIERSERRVSFFFHA